MAPPPPPAKMGKKILLGEKRVLGRPKLPGASPPLLTALELVKTISNFVIVKSIEIFNLNFSSKFHSMKKFLKRIGTGRWRNMEDARNMFWKWGCSQTYSQARVCRYIASQIHGPERKNIALVIQHYKIGYNICNVKMCLRLTNRL